MSEQANKLEWKEAGVGHWSSPPYEVFVTGQGEFRAHAGVVTTELGGFPTLAAAQAACEQHAGEAAKPAEAKGETPLRFGVDSNSYITFGGEMITSYAFPNGAQCGPNLADLMNVGRARAVAAATAERDICISQLNDRIADLERQLAEKGNDVQTLEGRIREHVAANMQKTPQPAASEGPYTVVDFSAECEVRLGDEYINGFADSDLARRHAANLNWVDTQRAGGAK